MILLADETLLDDRGKREQRGGRVAAGVRNELRACDALPIKFRETVDGRLEQIRRGMFAAVPQSVLGRVVQPEVRRDVDDLHAVPHEREARFSRRHLGKRREHHIDAAGDLRLDGHGHAGEVRQRVAQRLSGLTAPGNADDLSLGVAVQDARKFDACVSGYVDDADLHDVLILELPTASRAARVSGGGAERWPQPGGSSGAASHPRRTPG